MTIAWTYLLHAYYRQQKVDYRYFDRTPKRRRFHRTKHGAIRCWELLRCLNFSKCPLDRDTRNNLRFLIGLRDEIEHQMTLNLDNWLSGRYQACAINYNKYVKQIFGSKYGLDQHLTYSLQFIELSRDQVAGVMTEEDVPRRLRAYIAEFDESLTEEEYNSPQYAIRLLFTRKEANRKGQADSVFEFIDPNSEAARELDKQYWFKKEVERPKYLRKDVLDIVHKEGFKIFGPFQHTRLWRKMDAKNPGKGFGTEVRGTWYWYDRWIDEVRKHCEGNVHQDTDVKK
ncbi:MAG: DUF3644 domain-containing protein [Chloroflexi bacterium]|nr:DUF3644 domain-containing protein [Chloroflexota bacterium]